MTFIDHGMSRRRFLSSAGALAAGAALPRLLFATTGTSARLVVVILRGALDGLAAVPPHGDPAYAALHRDLAIAPPGEAEGALPLDSTFGLHPSLEFLHGRHAAGELIVLHAVASPYRDRSHFDGQNVLESGLTRPLGTADGWLNRALASLGAGPERSEQAVAISQNVPLILRGDRQVLSKSPTTTPDVDGELLARLEDLYSKDDWFSARLSEAVQSERYTDLVAAERSDATPIVMSGAQAMQPAPNRDGLHAAALIAAAIMKSDGGPEIAVMEASGWDTHANQGGAKGTLAQRLKILDSALGTLGAELGDLWSRTALLVITEFGRTAAMNGTRGTDHGTGGCAFLAGGAVQGGRVIADWPGLAPSALLDARDLRPTLDLRSALKGVLHEHLHIDTRTLEARVFPDSGAARALSGIMRA